MFSIGEFVVNENTGHIGEVIGYGHQILNNGYLTTIKVLVAYANNSGKRGVVEEDIYSVWSQYPGAGMTGIPGSSY